MKTSTKRFLTKLTTTTVSIAMALVMVIGFSLTPAAQVSAKAAPLTAKSTDDITWDITSSYKKGSAF